MTAAAELPLLEQAAGWFDRLTSDSFSREEREEFERWRNVPEHEMALAEVEAVHADARSIADHPDMLALRHEALSRIVMPRAKPKRRLWLGAVAASIAAGAIAIVTPIAPFDFFGSSHEIASVQPTLYRTAIGEQLTVNLPDGSSVTLNTGSRLRLAYTAKERRLILDEGEALFRVAKGEPRPFRVQALDRIVTAHGTTFDVRIGEDRKVKVALVEGLVSVANSAQPRAAETRLKPNEVLIASAEETQVTRDPEIVKDVSWHEGLIIFEDDSLAQATAEVNRYVRAPIILQDDELRRIRVSGAFRTGETGAFVEALEASFPVKVVERTEKRIVLAYRG